MPRKSKVNDTERELIILAEELFERTKECAQLREEHQLIKETIQRLITEACLLWLGLRK